MKYKRVHLSQNQSQNRSNQRTKKTFIALPLPETGFVREPTVLSVYPVSRAAWWAGVKAGRYPKAYKLGPRTTAWRAEDIRALIEKAE